MIVENPWRRQAPRQHQRGVRIALLANGCYGYLPTPKQHKPGGCETWLGTNKVGLCSMIGGKIYCGRPLVLPGTVAQALAVTNASAPASR